MDLNTKYAKLALQEWRLAQQIQSADGPIITYMKEQLQAFITGVAIMGYSCLVPKVFTKHMYLTYFYIGEP